METIYFDHGATTPMATEVIDTMTEVMTHVYGNPSSVHQEGRKSKAALVKARETIAKGIGSEPDEIIFTSGGTESNNLAIRQVAHSRQHLGKHLITTAVEHPSVLTTMRELVKDGFELTVLPVDDTGAITVAQVAAALRPDTILVSIMWTNNETGVNFPISAIGDLLQSHQAYFHSDGVQALSLANIAVKEAKVDLLSASAHKINGPKGVGFLYQASQIHLPALQTGGGQENNQRSGTENLAGICGFAKALELATDTRAERLAHYRGLQEQLTTELTAQGIDFEINGTHEDRSPHVSNLWLKGLPNQQVLMQLDLKGIAISIGSACSAGAVQPSHVLTSMFGQTEDRGPESVRISFGLGNTSTHVTALVTELAAISQRVR